MHTTAVESGRVALEQVGRQFDQMLTTIPAAEKRALAGLRRYLELCSECRDVERDRRKARADAVRALLQGGRLRDTDCPDWDIEWHRFKGIIPRALLAERERLGIDAVQAKLAAAALVAFDWRAQWDNASESERASLRTSRARQLRSGVDDFMWEIGFRPPAIPKCVYPATTTWGQLRRLDRADLLAIAYARLLAMRDSQSLAPLVDWPPSKQHKLEQGPEFLVGHMHWFDHSAIWPLGRAPEDGVPPLDPTLLPPSLAEKLLQLVRDDLACGSKVLARTGRGAPLTQNPGITLDIAGLLEFLQGRWPRPVPKSRIVPRRGLKNREAVSKLVDTCHERGLVVNTPRVGVAITDNGRASLTAWQAREAEDKNSFAPLRPTVPAVQTLSRQTADTRRAR